MASAQLRFDLVPWMQADSSCHEQPHLVMQAGLLLTEAKVTDL